MKHLKKLSLTLALLITAATGAWAQTEITTIPNGDFETWTYDGENMPNNWNSNATSDGSLNGLYGGIQLKRSDIVRPGSSGQYSCSIWSKSQLGVINIGILTSGRIHFGAASFTSSANYIYSDRDGSNTNKNVTNPCAMPFTGKPTAVKVWVKYVQGGTGYGNYATAKFSATIHGDADYVAYNLAEHDNDDNKALVVASAEQEIAYNNGEWEQLTIPFNYTDNNVDPAYILINAYTNAYPGKGKANDYLYIDDIELEYDAAIEVTTNAASEQDLFTEASFKMPAFDATVNYTLVRDMQDEANPVAFSGLPTNDEPIVVKKGDDGKYQPAETLTLQLIDPVAAAEAQNIIAADGINVKVLVGNGGTPVEFDQEPPITLDAFLADMKPGDYWIKAEPTDENSPYDGTVYSSQFTVVEQYDLTVKPASDFSKNGLDAVTVGSQSVTIDANTGKATKTGIAPDTEVKLKAKRGYVIEKVEAKKTVPAPSLNITNPVVGQVIGSDGKNYAYGSLPSGVTAVAKICYVSDGHGLALALADEGFNDWSTAKTTCAAHTPAFTGGTWKLASKDEWNSMINAAGSDTDLRDGFSSVGGRNMEMGSYWSSTEEGSGSAWYYLFLESIGWSSSDKGDSFCIRACLAF